MPNSKETLAFYDLLRRRGTSPAGNAAVEREILERYQDDCAVLVLDSSGFTRLTQRHGIIHFLSLVVAMHDRVKPLLPQFDALFFWSESDNIFAVFPTPRQALACAVRIQEVQREVNAGRDAAECLEVGIGVGCGKMLRIGRYTVYGDAMNLACKLGEDTARAGEILITESVFRDVCERVSGLDFLPQRLVLGELEIGYYKVQPTGPVTWQNPPTPQA